MCILLKNKMLAFLIPLTLALSHPGEGIFEFGTANAQNSNTYQSVTDERLLHPEPENWLMNRRTYDSWGYSPLDQINTKNVKKLVPAWTFSTGVEEGHQSPPIVNNGVMFITTPKNQVLALDAKTGDLLWRYRRELPEDLFQLHPTNRGVALYGDKVFLATVDAHLLALNARTGEVTHVYKEIRAQRRSFRFICRQTPAQL